MHYLRRYLGVFVIGLCLTSNWNVAHADDTQRLSGIDLSHHNDVSDWSEIQSAELSFVILKATDGMDYLDPTFDDRFTTLKTLGLIRGAYHFTKQTTIPWFRQTGLSKTCLWKPVICRRLLT